MTTGYVVATVLPTCWVNATQITVEGAGDVGTPLTLTCGLTDGHEGNHLDCQAGLEWAAREVEQDAWLEIRG